MKTLVIFTLAGALLGIALASWVVPPALSWYATPGGLPEGTQIQALVQTEELIRYATGRLIRYQAIGASVGAVAGLIGGILLSRKRATTDTPAPVSTSPTPTGLP